MKKITDILKFTGVSLAAVLLTVSLFSGCFSSFDPDTTGLENVPAGLGKVYFSIQDSLSLEALDSTAQARTVFPPEANNNFIYSAVFTGKDDLLGESVAAIFTGKDGEAELLAGSWKLTVEAKVNDKVVGRAVIENVTIVEGPNTFDDPVIILPLSDITDDDWETGTFKWSITFPNDLDAVDLSFAQFSADFDPDEDFIDVDLTDTGSIADFETETGLIIDGSFGAFNGEFELEPGSYLFKIILSRENEGVIRQAGKTVAVHVYPGLETVLDWEFDEILFSETKNVYGFVTLVHSVKVNVTAITLKRSSGSNFNDANFEQDDTDPLQWNFEAVTMKDAVNFQHAQLWIETDNNIIDIDLGDSVLIDDDDIDLGIKTIYALELNAGTGGKISVNGSAATANAFQVDFLDGADVELEAIADTNYAFDEFTGLPPSADEEGETASFIITEDTVVAASFISTSTPVTSVTISGANIFTFGGEKYLYLTPSGTAALSAVTNGTNQDINWSSDKIAGAGGVTVSATGGLTAVAALANTNSTVSIVPWTTITAESDDNASFTDTVRVFVLPVGTADTHTTDPKWKHIWNFTSPALFEGWMVYDDGYGSEQTAIRAASTNRTNLTLPNGMTLYADVFTSGSTPGIRWMPFQGTGCIQTSGETIPAEDDTLDFDPEDPEREYFLKIADVSVPFKITISYADTGSSGTRPMRYPVVYIDGDYIGTAATGSNGSTVTESFSYYGPESGPSTVTVQLGSNAGLRIFSISLEEIEPLGEGITISAAGDRKFIWTGTHASSAGILPAGNKTLQFNETTSKIVTWSINDSDSYAPAKTSTSAASINSSGLLTAAATLAASEDVWVFANDGTNTSDGYKVTVKAIYSVDILNQAPYTNLDGTGFNIVPASTTYSIPNGKSVGNLTVVAAGGMNWSTQSNSFDGFNLGTRIQESGTSTGIANRAVKFGIPTGKLNIILYLRGGSGTRNGNLSDGTTVIGTAATMPDSAARYEFEFENDEPVTDLYVYGSGGAIIYLGVLVEALDPIGNQAPVASDFIVKNLNQIENEVTDVVITPRPDKTTGAITINYESLDGTTYPKNTTVPQDEGTYYVTVNVAADLPGWNLVTDLLVGVLEVIGIQTPVASDYIIRNLIQLEGDVDDVTISPKDNKSGGLVTIYYEGTGSTTYFKSTTLPEDEGTYEVTFDVAEDLPNWAAEIDLLAGKLVIINEDNLAFKWEAGDGTLLLTPANPAAGTVFSIGGVNGVILSKSNPGFNIHEYGGLIVYGRFAIGSEMTEGTINASTSKFDPDGTLDLSKPFKVTVTYTDQKGSGNFRIALNANDSNLQTGPFGSGARWQAVPGADGTITTTTFDFTTNGNWDDEAMEKSFIGFGIESGQNGIVVTSILVEYVN